MESFIDRSIGLEATGDLTRMNVQYTDSVDTVLEDHGKVQRVEEELSMLRSQKEELSVWFKYYLRCIASPGCVS